MLRILFTAFVMAAGMQEGSDETEQIRRMRETVERQNAELAEKIEQEFLKLQNDLESSDPQQRANAIRSICKSEDVRLIPVIRALLSSPDPSTKQQAIKALYRLRAKGVGAEVGRLISDPDPSVQQVAAEYASDLGYQSTIEEVNRFLQDESPDSQTIAMHLCRTLPPEEALPVLGAFLHHELPKFRRQAVWDLKKYDDEWIRPYASRIIVLAADPDRGTQEAVYGEKERLQSLLTLDELRQLSDHKAPEVRALALRTLDQRGEPVSHLMEAALKAAEPLLRRTALHSFTARGEGPEQEIVPLLDDPDQEVREIALHAVAQFKFQSAVPKLQEIFSAEDWQASNVAARALFEMDQPLWGPTELPQVTGPLFEAAAKHAGGDAESWKALLHETARVVDELSGLKKFPCDRSKMISLNDLSGHPVTTRGPADDHTGGRAGGHTLPGHLDSVIVIHGNAAVLGIMKGSLAIVTGDLYLHDGYILDSIVLVQGRIFCDGYIMNSIVVAGNNKTLALNDGYVWGSVAVAGTIECDGYYQNSLLGGRLELKRYGGYDLRKSTRIDATPIYDLIGGTGQVPGN